MSSLMYPFSMTRTVPDDMSKCTNVVAMALTVFIFAQSVRDHEASESTTDDNVVECSSIDALLSVDTQWGRSVPDIR